jgi:hypothetical protein
VMPPRSGFDSKAHRSTSGGTGGAVYSLKLPARPDDRVSGQALWHFPQSATYRMLGTRTYASPAIRQTLMSFERVASAARSHSNAVVQAL